MNTDNKPALTSLPHKTYRQVTYGNHLTLWEPCDWYFITGSDKEVCLRLRLEKSEIASATEAVSNLLAMMIMGTLGICEIEPEDGKFFSITWPTYTGTTINPIPRPIAHFLKEFSLISPKHKQEAEEIREWIRTNLPLPF